MFWAASFVPERSILQPRPQVTSGRKWTARSGNRVLCVSVSSFIKSVRLLLTEGYPADTVVEAWRPNAAEWAMRGRLAAVAATVIDGETASRCAKNGSPARDPEPGSQRRLPLVCARPRVVSGADDDALNTSRLGRRHALRLEAIRTNVAKPSPAGIRLTRDNRASASN
jgi:hypothetical protein